jgi:hypothetical protein
MKKVLLISVALMFSFASFGEVKMMMFEDVGEGKTTFRWDRASKNGVKLTAITEAEGCVSSDADSDCTNYETTKKLIGFHREGRAVYFNDGESVVDCGKTFGFFAQSQFTENCVLTVEPKVVCTAWYNQNDCISAHTKYQVYLTIR